MKRYVVGLYLLLMSLISMAQLPPLQMSNEIRFIEGGVGLSESSAIEMEAKHWPVLLEFSQTNANKSEWVSNIVLVLKDANGVQLLSRQVDGPLILLDLKPGKYFSEATFGNQKLVNSFYVKNGEHKKISMNWK